MIESIDKSIDPMLLITDAKTGKQRFLPISHIISIRILDEKNIGGSSDQHAIAPRHDAGRKVQTFHHHSRLIVDTIFIEISQEADASASLAFSIESLRVVNHFNDVKRTIGTPIESDWVPHKRFGRNQFDFKPFGEFDRAERCVWRLWLCRSIPEKF